MAPTVRRSTGQSGRTKSPKVLVTKDQKEQSERFIETARKLESDESGTGFERAIGTLLKPSGVNQRPVLPRPQRNRDVSK